MCPNLDLLEEANGLSLPQVEHGQRQQRELYQKIQAFVWEAWDHRGFSIEIRGGRH